LQIFYRYATEFGFTIPDRSIVVDDIRVRGVGKTQVMPDEKTSPGQDQPRAEMVSYCNLGILMALCCKSSKPKNDSINWHLLSLIVTE